MYRLQPIPTGDIVLPEGLYTLSERLAEHNHDVRARRWIAERWRFGPERSDEKRTHPDFVPYAALPESEKQYDRSKVFETLGDRSSGVSYCAS